VVYATPKCPSGSWSTPTESPAPLWGLYKKHYEEHVNLIKCLTGDDFPLSHKRYYIARNVDSSEDSKKITVTERNATTPAIVFAGQQSEFDFDAYAKLTFASQEALQIFTAKVQTPDAAVQLAADEEKFLDRSKLEYCYVGGCYWVGQVLIGGSASISRVIRLYILGDYVVT